MRTIVVLAVMSMVLPAAAQHLRTGFDIDEYLELMKVSARTSGSPAYFDTIPEPENFTMVYQSVPIGLDNQWDLWTNASHSIALVSIRGTTQNSVSWLANFYAAMVPAKGVLQLSPTDAFEYNLSDHPQAAVHVGWLVSLAFLSREIVPRIDSSYAGGTRDLLIMGHSQGGAIAFLLTAYVRSLVTHGKWPGLTIKTYCSAGPKPGNLYFAYTYEVQTQGGWAFNVVNSADWVPEVPFSIQTMDDFTATNPFMHATSIIKKQKFPNNLVLRHLYNKLDKPTRRAQKNYQKYLGKLAAGFVQKSYPDYVTPQYYPSNHYVRTGDTILLYADEDYFSKYPDSKENVFAHHLHPQYMYLAEKMKTASGN